MQILVTDPMDLDAIDWMRQQGAEPILGFEESWEPKAEQIRAVIIRTAVVDAALMDRLPALEVIGKHGAGVNNIDLEAAAARNIRVTNVAGANANSVAEHAITLLMAATRAVVPCDTAVRGRRFRDPLSLPLSKEVSGTKLGLVGGGRIGHRVGAIAQGGFGCEVGVFDPYLPEGALSDLDATSFDALEDLFRWADNVVIAAPVTPENRNSIGIDELRALGGEGVIVISSRGGIVDEQALVEALRGGLVRAAGIDVFDVEPPEDDNELLDLEQVVLTPHFGGRSDAAMKAMGWGVCEQVWSLLNGGEAPLVGGELWLSPGQG